MTKKQWIADGLLLAAAIIWGSAFAVVKNTLDSVPPSMMIALRFGIAALISGVILRKHLRGLTRGQVLMGLLVGVLTGLAYIVQTIGLQDTTAGKNAFLTTIYVLLVPFGSAVLFHEKLSKRRYVAAVLMLLGIGILSLDGESGGLNRGDVLTLVCGVLYAAQIISVGRCNERMDTYALIVLEFAFAALTGLCWSLATERGMPIQWNMQSIGSILYVAVFSTMLASSCQNIAQKLAPTSHAALLMSLESVFGALSGVIFLGEKLTIRMGLGFLVIFAAVVLSETTSLSGIVEGQANGWNIFKGHIAAILAFVVFLIAGNAEANRGPFDLAEAEQELLAGYHTEYSGLHFGFFYLAEYLNLFITAGFASTLFLGGWMPLHVAGLDAFNNVMDYIPGFVWFFGKTFFVVWLLMWIKWTFVRLRIDQVLTFEWKYLMPTSLLLLVLMVVLKVSGLVF